MNIWAKFRMFYEVNLLKYRDLMRQGVGQYTFNVEIIHPFDASLSKGLDD